MSIVISTLPYVVTAGGSYVLKHSFKLNMSSGNAIEIKADNVTIDLLGYTVDNQGAGTGTTANGVYSTGFTNIKIKNGRISGFNTGIHLSPGSGPLTDNYCGYIVEGIAASANTDFGVQVNGLGNIVRNNQVIGSRTGIMVGRVGQSTVINNDIHETETGIMISANSGSVIDNNRIGRRILAGSSISIGISVSDSASVVIRRNAVYNMATGIKYDGYSWGMYIDNVVVCSTNPFVGVNAVAAGTTNYSMPCPH